MIDKDIKLWEEDGDLERMKLFFSNVEANTERKERIKQIALQKLAEVDQVAPNDSRPMSERESIDLELRKESLRLRIGRTLKSIWWRWQWKIAVPVVGIIILIMIGQSGMGNPLQLLSMGNSQSKASYDMAASGVVGAVPSGQAALNSEIANETANREVQSFRAEKKAEMQAPAPKTSASFADSANSTKGEAARNSAVVPPLPEPSSPPADPDLPRKITHYYSFNLQVEKVENSIERLKQEVTKLGGYIVESQQYGDTKNPSGNIVIKIPADKYEGVRAILPELGKILTQTSRANDITNQYYDTETRLRNWEAQEKRYLEILAQAKTVEDVMKVEGALGNIRMQIEQLKGQIKLWNHEIAYSTIQINLTTKPLPVNINDPWRPVSWDTTWQTTKNAFLKTISSTWNALNYLVVGIGYALPYLILVGIGWGGYRQWKKRRS
ncbi:MAG: DUF4349 domain-containing protein [Desulfitobacterium hafniense]|nr:DUF4349 domain-containing protein [Desulfitobacterium hafniense]